MLNSSEDIAVDVAVGRTLLAGWRLASDLDEHRSASERVEQTRAMLRSMGLVPPKSFRDLGVIFGREWDARRAAARQGRCVHAGMRWKTWHARICVPHEGACDPLPDP